MVEALVPTGGAHIQGWCASLFLNFRLGRDLGGVGSEQAWLSLTFKHLIYSMHVTS